MKNRFLSAFFVLSSVLCFAGGASAAEGPSPEKGRLLFNSFSLGGAATATSCASCHPSGAGLEKAWKNPNLEGQVNNCIAGPLKGSKLDVNSVEMQSLVLYIRSLKQ